MKKVLVWAALAIVVLLIVFAAWPRPLAVEVVACATGTIEAFVLEEAETRLDDEYVITMPVNGRLLRIDLKEGALVKKESVIARVDPFERQEQLKRLDAHVREIEALIVGVDKAKPKPEDLRAAELAVQEANLRCDAAKKSLAVARINYEQEKKQYERKKALLAGGSISQSDFDTAERQYLMLKTRLDEAASTEGAVGKLLEQAEMRRESLRKSLDDNEFQRAAYLAQIQQVDTDKAILRDELAKSEIRAPVRGPILEKYQEDEQVLPAGTPLLKIGDLQSIRIESDILSEEIGQVRVGQEVEIFGPAVGNQPIAGEIARIYPAGFKKISSLGIEQRRVKVIVEFDNSSLQLRPGVRLDIRIITDRKQDVLLVPERALLKLSDQWNVFAIRDGTAALTAVEIGLRNDDYAEIMSGLQPGDLVIPAPPQGLDDGDKVIATVRNN